MTSSAPASGATAADGQRRLVFASLLLVLLVFAACLWPFAEGRHFLYGDLGNWGLPMRRFYAESLREGRLPLWSPHLFCGFYLHGEGQVGMLHPLHWLLYRWLPFGTAFALECTFPYPFAFAGTYLFLRRLPVPALAAVGGATAFGLSTYLLVRYTHLNVPTILAHLPWLLWLADLSCGPSARTRRLAWIGIALLTASQVLLGYPGAVVFSIAYLGLYLLLRCFEARSLRPLLGCAAATALGLWIGAAQILPTLDLFETSRRAGALLSERTAQSLHPWNLLQPLSPYLFAQRVYQVDAPNPIEQAFYLGAAVPIALIWLAARRQGFAQQRRLLLCLAAACGLSLLIAMGRHAGLYQLIAALPLVGQLRVPARYTLVFHLAGAIVLALALADLANPVSAGPRADPDAKNAWRRATRWIWLAPLASGLIAIAALTFAGADAAAVPPGRRIASPLAVLLGPALSLACAALWTAAARGLRPVLAAIVLFVAADQAAFGASLWWSLPPRTLAEFEAAAPSVPQPEAGRVAMGFSDLIQLDREGNVVFHTSSRAVLNDVRLVWGYASLMPERVLPPFSPAALELAGTAYVLERGRFRRIADPLPRFRLVSEVRVTASPAADVAAVDLRSTALVETPLVVEPGPPGGVRLEGERPGEIRLAVDAPSRRLLVIAESFHRGWGVEIDGEAAPLLRVYGDFMGTVVDAGDREVVLRFRPRSFAVGLRLSAAGLLLVALLAIAAWRTDRVT